jgi:hypothetical protein
MRRSKRSSNFFGVFRNGEPIEKVPLKSGIKTGISQIGLLGGLVNELEEREAALFGGYTWKQWQEFDLLSAEGRYQRASGIAHYRIHHLIENHTEDAVSSSVEAKYKAAPNG